MQTTIFIISLMIMFAGLAGVIIPAVPGVPIVFGGALLFAATTGFAKVSVSTILIFAGLTALSFLLDWLSGTLGAKKFGATKWGIMGALAGALVGAIFGGIIGIIIGPIVGAIIFEVMAGRELQESMRAGIGVFIGFLLGTVLNIVLAVAMITMFVKAAT